MPSIRAQSPRNGKRGRGRGRRVSAVEQAQECKHLQAMKDGGVECNEGRLRCFASELWLRGWRRQELGVAACEADERRQSFDSTSRRSSGRGVESASIRATYRQIENSRSFIEKSIACRSTFLPVRQKGGIGRVVGIHILVHANSAWMGCEVCRCARCLSISNFLHGRKTWTTLSSRKRLCVLHGRDVRAPSNEHICL